MYSKQENCAVEAVSYDWIKIQIYLINIMEQRVYFSLSAKIKSQSLLATAKDLSEVTWFGDKSSFQTNTHKIDLIACFPILIQSGKNPPKGCWEQFPLTEWGSLHCCYVSVELEEKAISQPCESAWVHVLNRKMSDAACYHICIAVLKKKTGEAFA